MVSQRLTLSFLPPLLLLLLLCTNCEDPISIPTQFEEPQLVVDAWLDDQNRPQTITLNETVDYFSGAQPRAITDATEVRVCRQRGDTCFAFVHRGGGQYVWLPEGAATLGQLGDVFTLQFTVEGVAHAGESTLFRTAIVDSINLTFEEATIGNDEGLYAELYARDWPGQGDAYWLRSYKNDTLLNRPSEIVTIFDAGFSPGTELDGVYFITPLRQGINAIDDDGGPVPFVAGDRIYTEVHSLNRAAFDFLQIASEQIENTGLFAVPVANARGNVVNTTTGQTILGIFNVAAVKSIEKIVD